MLDCQSWASCCSFQILAVPRSEYIPAGLRLQLQEEEALAALSCMLRKPSEMQAAAKPFNFKVRAAEQLFL